jgi:hypothetical protein
MQQNELFQEIYSGDAELAHAAEQYLKTQAPDNLPPHLSWGKVKMMWRRCVFWLFALVCGCLALVNYSYEENRNSLQAQMVGGYTKCDFLDHYHQLAYLALTRGEQNAMAFFIAYPNDMAAREIRLERRAFESEVELKEFIQRCEIMDPDNGIYSLLGSYCLKDEKRLPLRLNALDKKVIKSNIGNLICTLHREIAKNKGANAKLYLDYMLKCRALDGDHRYDPNFWIDYSTMGKLPEEENLKIRLGHQLKLNSLSQNVDDGIWLDAKEQISYNFPDQYYTNFHGTGQWLPKYSEFDAKIDDKSIEIPSVLFTTKATANYAKAAGLKKEMSVPQRKIEWAEVDRKMVFGAVSSLVLLSVLVYFYSRTCGKVERPLAARLEWCSPWWMSWLIASISVAATFALVQIISMYLPDIRSSEPEGEVSLYLYAPAAGFLLFLLFGLSAWSMRTYRAYFPNWRGVNCFFWLPMLFVFVGCLSLQMLDFHHEKWKIQVDISVAGIAGSLILCGMMIFFLHRGMNRLQWTVILLVFGRSMVAASALLLLSTWWFQHRMEYWKSRDVLYHTHHGDSKFFEIMKNYKSLLREETDQGMRELVQKLNAKK